MTQFIRASAGTGKTHTLLHTIFNFDEEKCPQISYEQAVAAINQSVFLTFSNSAAEEIRSRLYEALSKCKKESPQTDMAEQIFSPSLTMRAFTIHAFALDVIRLFRYKLGLPADLDFTEEGSSLWQHCVDDYFSTCWDAALLKQRFELSEPEDVALFDLFFTLTEPKVMRKFIKEKGDQIFFLWKLKKTGAYDVPAHRAQLRNELNALGINPEQDYHAVLESLKQAAPEKICPTLNKCSYFVDKIVADIGEQYYMPYMFANGLFDFDAVVYLLVQYITDGGIKNFYNDLARENYAFTSLYIDEAQDNDVIQNYLIILFDTADCPVQVTVVGDLKQSIYIWRNSYPAEFNTMLQESAAPGPRKTAGHVSTLLRESYRIKSPQTLEMVNGLCNVIKEQEAYKSWWYETDKDALQAPKRKPLTAPAQLKLWKLAKKGKTFSAAQRKELKAFLQQGHNGVLLRNRSDLAQIAQLPDVLREINANYRIDTSLAADERIRPEINFIKIFFNCLTTSLLKNVPFMLFWSSAGHLISEQMKDSKQALPAADRLKHIFEELYEDVRTHRAENRIERLLTLLDTYKIWSYFRHENQTCPLHTLRRVAMHILISAYLKEKRNHVLSGGLLADGAGEVLKQGMLPLDTYTLDQENTSTEIVTIHGSKGLTYDSVVIVTNFQTSFFPNSTDHKKFGPQYGTLFNINFEKVLTANPQLKISYFPYLGTQPAGELREGTSLWEDSLAGYRQTQDAIIQECLNLLYVAITRARKNILMIDLGGGKVIEDLLEAAHLSGVHIEAIATDAEEAESKQDTESSATNTPVQPVYQENQASWELMPVEGALQMRSVRSEIDKTTQKYGHALNSLQRLEHVKTGSMVHNLLQRLIGRSASAEELAAHAQTTQAGEVETLRVRAADIVCTNKDSLQRCGLLWQPGYGFVHEVPLWHFDTQTKELVKGSVDTLGIKEDQVIILEYKVLFGPNDSQKEFARAQLQIYKKLLQHLCPAMHVDTVYIPLREGKG